MNRLNQPYRIESTEKYQLPNGTALIIFVMILSSAHIYSQELEPRSLTNVPVGTNFAVAAYGFSWGNVLLDPALPIEDLDARLHTTAVAWVRTIDFFGMAGKVNVVVPSAAGDWNALFFGTDTSTSRFGLGDPRFRISFNFLGSPALTPGEYKDYDQKTIAGFSFQMIAPLGQYDPSKLINLSSNRFTFRPQFGVSHRAGRWYLEGYFSTWIFTNNKDFYGGNELRQNPLYTIKLHCIRALPKRIWVSGDVGYGLGGRTFINSEKKDTRISTFRFGFTLAVPLGIHHSLKFDAISGARLERGGDYDVIAMTYQYRWNKNTK